MVYILLIFIAWFASLPTWLSIVITTLSSIVIICKISVAYHKVKTKETLESVMKEIKNIKIDD